MYVVGFGCSISFRKIKSSEPTTDNKIPLLLIRVEIIFVDVSFTVVFSHLKDKVLKENEVKLQTNFQSQMEEIERKFSAAQKTMEEEFQQEKQKIIDRSVFYCGMFLLLLVRK